MVIFNIHAIIIAIVALLFSLPFIIAYNLGWINDHILVISMSWMVLVASLAGKSQDIVGRLFFIPMWILSIPLPLLITFFAYGWTGILVTFSILISPFILILFIVIYQERKKADNIHTTKPDLPNYNNDPLAFWEAFKKNLYFPSYVKMRPTIAAYNLRVVEEVEKQGVNISYAEEFKNEANKYRLNPNVKKMNKDVVKLFLADIDFKISQCKEQQETTKKIEKTEDLSVR